MTVFEEIRHIVRLAGRVTEAQTGAGVPGAQVEIVQGPAAFESLRAAFSGSPGWDKRTERLDRKISQAGGFFFFLDLPAGTYRLKASMPSAGKRYGVYQSGDLVVTDQRDANGKAQVTQCSAALPPGS